MSSKRSSPMTPIIKTAEVPWDLGKNVTGTLMKMTPSFVSLFLGFLVLDFLVTIWNRWAGASSWRANSTAENIRTSVGELFGDSNDGVLRDVAQILLFGIVTYASVKRYGKTTMALAAPVAVFILAAVLKFILRQSGKYTWGGANPTNFGDIFYNYLSGIANDRLLAGVQNGEGSGRGRGGIDTVLGIAIGFLAAA